MRLRRAVPTFGFMSLICLAGPSTPAAHAGDEAQVLANPVQLTSPAQFVKAGESYFSPDDRRIIFQGIERPANGSTPEDIYAMYLGDVVYENNDTTGRILGMTNIHRLTPPGSANTCGWFHPEDSNIVMFASTVGPPSDGTPPGYHRKANKYKWMFPPEMRIFQADISDIDNIKTTLLVGDEDAYQAEGSYSPDGRYLLYCSLETGQGDIFVQEIATGDVIKLISAPGYDGGPFFSPDGTRICYRSDRNANNLLQIFVAELAFDDNGKITGIDREFQLTDNLAVNWCPFWHPDGRHLVYATSEVEPNHSNYEVFIIDAAPGEGVGTPAQYGTKKRRVTSTERFDGLPVFNSTGSRMLWTSQRGNAGTSQLWVADFVMDIDAAAQTTITETEDSSQITIRDPENDAIYIYDARSHVLSLYDMNTHTTTEVTDPKVIERVMKLHKDG